MKTMKGGEIRSREGKQREKSLANGERKVTKTNQ